ncbi:DnaA regulatory inactivator Hda [Alteromonas sp. 1_MG-2023]|uniref:DnaA regulatory inactivator Hda n=1 Tax=Alteromonas sp. 1_MG-2023 TaxID=3062669 RepID=UPI0026E22ED7|nr:DnaA regulatory inactivator Hda [Alteromonas sp. 1_MG-2023]MDO6476889.1 DnaA regulatory inactivator Hda [Alteromonas sp. 1_MG-2023]
MQLPLAVSLPDDETFSSFEAGENSGLADFLSALSQSGSRWRDNTAFSSLDNSPLAGVGITGAAGRGKSHLLYAVCHQLAFHQTRHIYLNLREYADWTPVIFDGLERLPYVCLDNIDAIAGIDEWEEALFHFINRMVDNHTSIFIWTSSIGPNHPAFKLPDLRSRLSWGITWQLAGLTDNERLNVLKKRAAQRGMRFSEQALAFLLTHCDRDLPALLTMLDRLDTRSLQEQKKLSVAMIKRELEKE